MKILIVEPGKHPRIEEITGSLKSMQEIVGGYIQAIYPFDDPIALVCDEEGLFKGTKWNRRISKDCAIKGPFFLCGLDEEDFADLPDALVDQYIQRFWEPEEFEFTPPPIRVIGMWGLKG